MGEMWCYQKPGFEALLLTGLQRQQQRSQFCDTVLQTGGVSVPAHSCILSAISPRISSSLSSMAPLPAGQSRLLEFRALRDCTLLNMVRLLYSGEMAGEGAKEKQEAISAAAKLGIHGLVEVTKRDYKSRNEEGEGRPAEVGVQTEPVTPEEDEGRRGRWRTEVRDGCTFLWKETLSEGGQDKWTQTEELQLNTDPPSHPTTSFETIDMAALQSLGQTDPHLLPPDIPYVPISLIYPPNENQTPQLSSALAWQEPTAAGSTSVAVVAPPSTSSPPSLLPFTSQPTLCPADPKSWWAGPQGAATDVASADEWEDEHVEQFQGNIAGYINHFLNPDKEEGSRRGRPRRRRGAGVGGARRAGTGERRARRPRARTGGRGRGRGGLMQTVDVQEVGVSRLQKLFLQRWGMAPSWTGQGGGAVGRRLCLKTRELLKPAKSCQRRRRRGKAWEFSQSGEFQTARAKPTASVCFSSPPVPLCSVHTLSARGPPLQPTPSHNPLSPGASYVSPASSFLHTTCLPPPEEQSRHVDCLVEEVMMGLNFLPNSNNNSAPHSQPPTSSGSCAYASSGSTVAQNKPQSGTAGTLGAGHGFHECSSGNSEVPVLQQQGQGELNEMLEQFLQYFEQHVDSSSAREEVETGGPKCTEASQPYTVLRKYRKTKTRTATPRPQSTRTPETAELQQNDEAETQPRRSQPPEAAAGGPPGEVTAPAKRRRRKRTNQYLFSMEKKRVRVRKPATSDKSASEAKTKIGHDRRDEQLQRMPVVKLERSGPLPVRVTVQGHNCLEVKSSAETKTSSSSPKNPRGSLNETVSQTTKMYPIRSRLRETHIVNTKPLPVQPLVDKQPPSTGRKRGRPRKTRQPLSSSNGESAKPTIQPRPVDEKLENNQERREEELTVQPQEEAEGSTKRGKRRGAESEEETSDDAAVAKRVRPEQAAQPISEACTPSSGSADFVSEPAATETEDVIGVLLTSVADCLQREEQKEITTWREIKRNHQSSGDETVDVDGGAEDVQSQRTWSRLVEVNSSVSPPSRSAKEVSPGSKGSLEEDTDEDIDVAEADSAVPDPVTISWTESSEGEEEKEDKDVDVVG